MAIEITSQPAAVFPAYNPAPLVLTATNSEADVEMHLVIDGVSVTHHKREFFSLAEPLTDNFGNPITDNDGMPIPIGGDTVAVFDLGKLARNYFSNALVEINAVENATSAHAPAYIDRRLGVPFTAEITGVSSPVFAAINAAYGVGTPEGYTLEWYDNFLTEMSSLKFYPNFTNHSMLSVLLPFGSEQGRIWFSGDGNYVEIRLNGATVLDPWGGTEYMQFVFSQTGPNVILSLTQAQAEDLDVVREMLADGINTQTDKVAEILSDGLDYYVRIYSTTGFTQAPYIEMQEMDYDYVVLLPNITSAISEGAGRIVSVPIPSEGDINLIDRTYAVLSSTTGFRRLMLELTCVPSSPFYVRWVNRIGGREHFMFSRRQTDKTDIDESVTYDPRIETNADLGRFPRQIGLTSTHTVTVGAEGIPNAEFDVLRRITTSPLIEYYDEGITEWRVITIKSGETAKDTASPVQSIELEFNLPSPALQF